MRARFTFTLGLGVYLLLSGGLLLAAASNSKRAASAPRGKVKKLAAVPRRQAPSLVEGQTATLLPDGRWLLVGGKGPDDRNARLSTEVACTASGGVIAPVRQSLNPTSLSAPSRLSPWRASGWSACWWAC